MFIINDLCESVYFDFSLLCEITPPDFTQKWGNTKFS